jgi:hypothetical protein
MHLLTKAIPRFIRAPLPPKAPHVVIEPSALRAAKALTFE